MLHIVEESCLAGLTRPRVASSSHQLLSITASSVEYITHRTQFKQTSAAIPTTLHTTQAARGKDYRGGFDLFAEAF